MLDPARPVAAHPVDGAADGARIQLRHGEQHAEQVALGRVHLRGGCDSSTEVFANLTHAYIGMYCHDMARQATTSDVFNAVGDLCRRDILDVLAEREATVGELVDRLGLAQPQASKHLRVLRDVGLVRCRADGRRRVYRIHGPAFGPLRTWLTQLTTSVNVHYDRLDDYLDDLQSAASPEPRQDI